MSSGGHEAIPGADDLINLGAAPLDAKGTARDYLAHPSAIPAQIMAVKPASFRGG